MLLNFIYNFDFNFLLLLFRFVVVSIKDDFFIFFLLLIAEGIDSTLELLFANGLVLFL